MCASILQADKALGMSINAAMPLNMQELSAVGITCIEVTWRAANMLSDSALAQCDRIIRDAERCGIRVWSLHLPYGDDWDPSSVDDVVRDNAISGLIRLIDFACDRNIHTLVIHPSFEPIAVEAREERLRLASLSLGILARHAAERGARLAAECLPRTCLAHSADEMLMLLADNPELWVCADVNHLFHETPGDFIRKIGDKIITTHISDNDANDEQHWYPGEGTIDWQDTLSALQEVGYDGPIMYEVRNHTAERVYTNWRSIHISKGDE